ncbi:fasciclin domain-containing protein [Pseudopontixanthobacter vadosimaris]|uniref:fasciclin domain-containing protein n=1 Tax=Pseudopontixanthobacter vadosimaris TaxID=2726450 RepID=UPI0014765686|nr:fasciclin domain-containing protein [Pseudopontixanthobacter vadosimaris]
MRRGGAWFLVATAAIGLSACSSGDELQPDEQVSTRTLASVIAEDEGLSRLSSVLTRSGLGAVFDGPGSYTVLAPGNDALAGALPTGGDDSESLPIMVALLRDHILPGHLTPAIIRQAIADQGGPVEMRTLGKGVVSFSIEGETLVATQDGSSVPLAGRALVADNGVVLPLKGAFTSAPTRVAAP